MIAIIASTIAAVAIISLLIAVTAANLVVVQNGEGPHATAAVSLMSSLPGGM